MRYAVVKDNKVINIIDLDTNADWKPEDNTYHIASVSAEIGDDYIDGELAKKEVLKNPLTNLEKIAELESQITPRRLRESVLGVESSLEFIEKINVKIMELRG